MLKFKYLIFAALVMLGGYLVGGIVRAETIPLNNSDFESGTLTGWTTFTTDSGTLGGDPYPRVIDFDMDRDGIDFGLSKVAQFNVGKISSSDKGYQGGGIYQVLYLSAGDYTLSALVAADESGTQFGAWDGGLFELMVDDIVVDKHEFAGPIGPNQTQHKLMSGLHVVADGNHSVGIRITRSSPVAPSVTQYIDNVSVSATASVGNTSTDDTSCQNGQDNKGKGNNSKGGNKGCSNGSDGLKSNKVK